MRQLSFLTEFFSVFPIFVELYLRHINVMSFIFLGIKSWPSRVSIHGEKRQLKVFLALSGGHEVARFFIKLVFFSNLT